MLTQRYSKICVLFLVTLWLSLVACGNIIDYKPNLEFTRHILMMDTIFPSSNIYYRAIVNPALVNLIFITIVILETICALLCLVGTYKMFLMRHAKSAQFNNAKKLQ